MTELPKTHEAEVISELVKHIDAANHSLRIFSGEANCNVYNRPDVEAALERAYKRGVRVQIIAGPILSVCLGSGYRSAILEKAQQKKLQSYFRNRRSTEQHFCIADETMGVRQEYHPPMVGYDEPPKPIPSNEILSLIEKFDNWISTGIGSYNGHSFTVQLSQNPERQFLLLPEKEVQRACNKAKDRGLRFDDLTREEVKKLLRGGIMSWLDHSRKAVLYFLVAIANLVGLVMLLFSVLPEWAARDWQEIPALMYWLILLLFLQTLFVFTKEGGKPT